MIKLLTANGFKEERQNGSHKFFVNENTNRRTTVPCHCKDLPKGTEQIILKQAGPDLEGCITCGENMDFSQVLQEALISKVNSK